VAVKTYIFGLSLVLKAAHKYMTRYQAQLQGSLTSEQYTCLVSTIEALADCIVLIPTPPDTE